MSRITVFLPCRAGSQRIPNKNTRSFAGIYGGLLKIKLDQLVEVKAIDQIIVSTNDEVVKKLVQEFKFKNVEIDDRPDQLGSSETSTDDLIKYVPTIIHNGHVLWTHVTSPFYNKALYEKAINQYHEKVLEGEFDSLMSVTTIQKFLWNKETPINYDRNIEKWPRTQTLEKVYEVDSGIFLNSIENYKSMDDRIGKKPSLFEVDSRAAMDIDWPMDFEICEKIYQEELKF